MSCGGTYAILPVQQDSWFPSWNSLSSSQQIFVLESWGGSPFLTEIKCVLIKSSQDLQNFVCVCIIIYSKSFALKHQNQTFEMMCGDTSVRKKLKLEEELWTSFIHLNDIYIPGSAVNVMKCPCCVLKRKRLRLFFGF